MPNAGFSPPTGRGMTGKRTAFSSLHGCHRKCSKPERSGWRDASTPLAQLVAGSQARAPASGGIFPGMWATCWPTFRTPGRRGIRAAAKARVNREKSESARGVGEVLSAVEGNQRRNVGVHNLRYGDFTTITAIRSCIITEELTRWFSSPHSNITRVDGYSGKPTRRTNCANRGSLRSGSNRRPALM